MKILDCETIESTYASLIDILNISKDEINGFFEEFKFQNKDTAEKEIFTSFQKKYKINISFDGTCFFHATRCDDIKRYENGILPLNQILDVIWDFLYSLIKDRFDKQDWDKFRNDLENGLKCSGGDTYRLRSNKKLHSGPDAFLIKEVIFKPEEFGNHNYLETSEIIEDICICFKGEYNIDLLQEYIKKTNPCIIKFKTSCTDQIYIDIALLYLYTKYKNIEMGFDCCIANPSDGNKIEANDICWIKMINIEEYIDLVNKKSK